MYLVRRWRNGLVAAVLILTLVFSDREAERYGDNFQIALPLAALGCAVATGAGGEYLLRFLGMWTTTHASKQGLGEAAINIRPGGGDLGFPSGHTSASAFGASSLVFACLTDAPLIKTGVVFAAAFTGASRIEADKHTIWQVLAGAIWAVLWERALRRPGPVRDRVVASLRRVLRTMERPLRVAGGWARSAWRRR
ncbi:phosphatase PAP2 family protein [Roseitranquillus sediminis]|uniref:phosphatase PAP2 family protein n=1 Tax=Roseitranquillus sediminis TaxID=2809051 RepID=UPI001D0C51F4|nr:phosphatase PAP2 family protein [Roseitranquillus sediminis]MBM9593514.1 phosphatase PAP2 family protein [Roseitranquillus sediminis]